MPTRALQLAGRTTLGIHVFHIAFNTPPISMQGELFALKAIQVDPVVTSCAIYCEL